MDKRIIIGFIIMLLCSTCVLSCSEHIEDKAPLNKNRSGQDIIPVNEHFSLEPSQKQELEELAEKGNGDAAQRLYVYYTLCIDNENKAMYWMKKAAENGNPVAQRNLGIKMREFPEYGTEEEAKYWLNKAADAGNWDAKIELGRRFSDDELKTLLHEGEEGDAQSALTLYTYYEKVEKDDKRAKYWFKRWQEIMHNQ